MNPPNEILVSFDLDYTLMKNPFRQYVFPELNDLLQPSGEKTVRQWLNEEHTQRLGQGQFASAYDWDNMLQTVGQQQKWACQVSIKELVQKHAVPGKVWLFSDVLPTLQQLKQRDIPMVVATNGFACYQRPVTDCLGITPYFQAFYTPEEIQLAKPQPEFFQFGCRRKLIHVGDRLDQDILGANLAGAVSVWINREFPIAWRDIPAEERKNHPEVKSLLQRRLQREGSSFHTLDHVTPDYILASLDELLPVLEKEMRKKFC
ncbi:HAD family hydrolase [Paenactinomyces guangxiensis]|uniref:HAD family hydrolase n=2 Tax=Paenactinomyces guangxiensis TaxID=1490290 RepID=A0A7W1WN70_9BACL|nr:HAD family hydrolase [Paenactinomyces guangxiensis]MBH8590256.1 HAD family hydrolase [Paenactinomyces guangxiensis]